MLVKFTDKDGLEVWINPIHVKFVRENRGTFGAKKGSVIGFSQGAMVTPIIVSEVTAEVARRISEAMPKAFFLEPTSEDDFGGDFRDDDGRDHGTLREADHGPLLRAERAAVL
ncbi:MAG: hypothetical protein ACK48N_11260, partial [Planctomyces sp.]